MEWCNRFFTLFLIYNTYNTFYCMLVSPFLYWHLHHILDIFFLRFKCFFMSTRISFTLLHILCNQNVCCLFNISVRLIVLNISCAFIEVLTEWIFICVVNLYRSHNLSIINFWCDIKTVIQVYISTECLLHRLCNTQILVWSRSYI